MTLNSRVYHKQGCARCYDCNTNLSINNFAFSGDRLYCKTHYLSNFSKTGGRYSFANDDHEPKPNKRVSVAPSTEPRPKSEMQRQLVTPVKAGFDHNESRGYNVPASAPADSNRLQAFLSSAGKISSDSSETQTKSTPVKSVPTNSKYSSALRNEVTQKQSTPVAPSNNKLAAFLSTAEKPKPREEEERKRKQDQQQREKFEQTAKEQLNPQGRPLSLKERIAIYSMEAANGLKSEENSKEIPLDNVTRSKDLPPLPRKESLQSLGTEKKGEQQHQENLKPALGNIPCKPALSAQAPARTNQHTSSAQTAPSQNRLSAFLQSVEPGYTNPTAATGLVATNNAQRKPSTGSMASAQNDGTKCQDILTQRRESVNIKERIALYSAEASKSNHDKVGPPQLPPGKPKISSPVAKGTVIPRQSFSESPVKAVSRTDSSQLKEENSSRPISLKERITSYQARASGRKSNPSSTSEKQQKSDSPISGKKSGFRGRFPSFLKHQVYASPNYKNSEFLKNLKKICDDGATQVSKVSAKNFQSDTAPELKAVAMDLLEAFDKARKRLATFDEEKKRARLE